MMAILSGDTDWKSYLRSLRDCNVEAVFSHRDPLPGFGRSGADPILGGQAEGFEGFRLTALSVHNENLELSLSVSHDPTMQKMLLRVICACVSVRHSRGGTMAVSCSRNEVSWLSQGNGLLFGKHGSIVSANPFQLTDRTGGQILQS